MPYNSPMKKKGSSCMQMKDHKGKPSGLMMEGSVAHQEIDSKASAMEMSPYKMDHGGSPNKMSPLNDNHWKIDPKTGKKVDEFGTPVPEGFVSSTAPYEPMNAPGTTQEYDEEEASRMFTGAQNQVLNALDLAERQLGGEEVFNTMLRGGYGSTSLTGPQAAQIITGYSSGEKGSETVGGGGRVRFNIDAVRSKLDELKKLAIKDPVSARSYVSKRISGAPLGDIASRFSRDIDPLKRNK